MSNTLGSRIRYLREEKHLSQLEMAKELNISNVQLSRYEAGSRKPDPEMLVQIADYLNVSADYLLGRIAEIRELSSTYVTQEDVQLVEKLRQSSEELLPFIQDLTNHPEKVSLFLKIWQVIKENS